MGTNRGVSGADLPPIYAHRFGSDYGPESSRQALERTLADGVDGIEADVVLTADDRVLALHDPVLGYSTDLEGGWTHERSADELTRARLLGTTGEPENAHPMTLEEVLDVIPPTLPFQLDVKAYADHRLARRTATRACEVLRAHGTEERAEVISFFTSACTAACARGLATRIVIWADYAPGALAEWVVSRGITGVSVEGFILQRELVRGLHEAGLTISAGAVNNVDQARLLLPLEVDILVSDRPHELRRELDGESES